MEALYPILIVLGVGAAIGAYITYRYLISKHKKVVEYLELRNQKSLAAEIEEKEEVIEKYKNKDIAREVEHNNLKNELRQIIEINRIKSKEILGKAVDFAFDFETIFREQHHSAQEEIQKVLDDTYRYKRKTLLASVTLRNFEKKLEDIRREKAIYQTLIAKYDFFQLRDHSDWKVVEKEFRDKVLELQAAQDERDAQNEIKRQMREERQRAEELERQQQEAEAKEQELEARRKAVEEALLAADEEHRQELEETRRQLEQEIEDVHKQYERAKSMAQMTKQGHVYIISNIGSFGENVFKIGMTRRLEPLDRVSELSGASVPFEFDVHAMISCDDAPALEYALHNKLSSERMNKVNLRKEFFKTELNKIIQCVEEHHGKVEYVADPAALQYYRSLEIAEEAQNNKELLVAS
ncbi:MULTISPECIES: GIY-YIG nuclease family protein [Klebsiella/Raoultella group]|uniref:GIY-YIG nuclease family protein n=1 Tax=Klebsiella/Raoultella group TaxID=2890311 RepID=UPI0014954654|nr:MULTISPECIES: GIY-YIG nuclease family protein [Klebsiella/Raoultella group]MCS6028477.1 GIY-YIG nuclease family protein [Klebsiella quasipneumoniae subsp. quasipneumoniae]HCI6378441.1 GIY-YIG nuclease family protein [Klebsiella quasipneumoniae subsp. similipneumoniae]HDU4297859.1 GIY-YIG nuclease family protein [Klebsiella variicola]EKW2601884.1 GIY-YIG nuclease family protein [Klebsiella quasipneumoniae]MCQ9598666.1 GIY-YIG nuclease family protein [Klebsiella pneumoniae]